MGAARFGIIFGDHTKLIFKVGPLPRNPHGAFGGMQGNSDLALAGGKVIGLFDDGGLEFGQPTTKNSGFVFFDDHVGVWGHLNDFRLLGQGGERDTQQKECDNAFHEQPVDECWNTRM